MAYTSTHNYIYSTMEELSLVNLTFATYQHMITFRMGVWGGGRSRDLGPLAWTFGIQLLDESRAKHAIIAYVTPNQQTVSKMWW